MPSELLVPPATAGTTIVTVTPERAGWTYVGFEALRLAEGETASRETGDREVGVVVISRGAGGGAGTGLGSRPTPFEGAPDAAYLPPGSIVTVRGGAGGAE